MQKNCFYVSEKYEDPVVTVEIGALSSIYPEKEEGIYFDSMGNQILDEYGEKVASIAKNALQIKGIEGISREINLIVSQDAHKFHQDQFKRQYDFLNANHARMSKCKLFHDLTSSGLEYV